MRTCILSWICSVTLLAAAAGKLAAQQAEDPFAAPPNNAPNQQQAPTGNGAPLNGKPGVPQKPAAEAIKPVPFKDEDGDKIGWKISMPGRRPLATPAVVGGVLYIGGGFGSHEFYAFDAKTGEVKWLYHTADDGPTAAVVQDGYVGFNTESCELEILTLDGKPVWKKWLGDPLMSMPAIGDGKVFMCYPESRGDQQHHIACFDLKTGREIWKKAVAGETITAPVLAQARVYVATLEGSMYCFDQAKGELLWQEKKNATSSPTVWNEHCYFSRREELQVKKDGKQATQQTENLSTRTIAKGGTTVELKDTRQHADYLDFGKRAAASAIEQAQQMQDASVGFGVSKGSAKIMQAQGNLRLGSVCGIWAYQGSRPFVYNSQLYAAMGDTLSCLEPKTEKAVWKKAFRRHDADKGGELLDALLTPPAFANDKVFVGTSSGELIVLSARNGEELRRFKLGEPVAFQPVVAGGCLYASTSRGSLYCVATGEEKDDGWMMWGGTAAHNGLATKH